MAGNPRKPAINHHAHAFYRQRGLGNRTCQHDLAPSIGSGTNCGILFARFHRAMQLVYLDGLGQARLQAFGRAAYLGQSRKKDQHRAGFAGHSADHGLCDAVFEPLPLRRIFMGYFNRKAAAGAFDMRAIAQKPAQRSSIKRCRHHHDPQIGPKRGLHIKRQCQAEICVKAAFVKLVEYDGGNTGKFGIAGYHAGEDALGHIFDARCR